MYGARVAHVAAIFRARKGGRGEAGGADENSTLEIRRTYVARNASQESYTERDASSFIHLSPFSTLSMPVHLAERNCQEVRGSLDALRCHNCEIRVKKKETQKGKRRLAWQGVIRGERYPAIFRVRQTDG